MLFEFAFEFNVLLVISLDDTNPVSNIKRIVVFAQSNIGLLQALGGNKSVDLFAFNIVKIPYSSLDLTLVGLKVNDKYKSVAVLNQLHGRLGCQGVLDDGVLVQSVLLGGTLFLVLGLARKTESLGPVEVDLGVNAGPLLGDSLLEGLSDCCCLSCDHHGNKTTTKIQCEMISLGIIQTTMLAVASLLL
jgi:hypothetical protein